MPDAIDGEDRPRRAENHSHVCGLGTVGSNAPGSRFVDMWIDRFSGSSIEQGQHAIEVLLVTELDDDLAAVLTDVDTHARVEHVAEFVCQ